MHTLWTKSISKNQVHTWFKNAKCYKCHGTGHSSSVCRSGTANPDRRNVQYVRCIKEPSQQNNDINSTIFQVLGRSNPFGVELIVQAKLLKFEIDTGAEVTLISEKSTMSIFRQKSLLTLKTPGNHYRY